MFMLLLRRFVVLVERWSGHDAWWGSRNSRRPRWKLNPKNFGPNIKSIEFLESRGEGKNLCRSGFRKQQKLFLGLNLCVSVHALFGNFSKAFDRVDHNVIV